MASLQKRDDVSKIVEEILDRLSAIKPNRDEPTALQPEIKDCGKHIRQMNTALKASVATDKQQHIKNCLTEMPDTCSTMKSPRKVVDSGYKPSNPNRQNYASTRVKWVELESAFKNRIRSGAVENIQHKDPVNFMQDAKGVFTKQMRKTFKKEMAVKVNATFCGEFVVVRGHEEIRELEYLKTQNFSIYNNDDIGEWFTTNVEAHVLAQLEEFEKKDSGWSLAAIKRIFFNINKFTPQVGSCDIKLPRAIELKHACINVKNKDEACFAWAVMAALYPVDNNPQRTSKYPQYKKVFHLGGIRFPMTLRQIPRFEKQNSVSINVYILEKTSEEAFNVVPTYLTKNKQEKHVNLLLFQDVYDDNDNGGGGGCKPRFHYAWIKDLSRLVSSQLSRHRTKKYICDRCLHYFCTERKLEAHSKDCTIMNKCKVRLPTVEQASLQFKNYRNKEAAAFVIYADLECLLIPVGGGRKTQEHIPYSIGYYRKCSYDDSLSVYRSYRGEDCQKWFANEMKELAEDIEPVFLCPLPIDNLTPAQKLEFRSVPRCHICEQPFSVGECRVRDHCHITGKYRGAAHKKCNINYTDSRTVPVVFHNRSGYDLHIIIKNLANDFEGRVDLLPANKERYISFTKNVDDNLIKFRFIDSFRFGLESLASNLDYFPNLRSQFENLDGEKFKLLTRKGVFPYDYVDSFLKLDESNLPVKSKFYNSMIDAYVTDDDFKHANDVWKAFDCKNLGEYSDFYLKTDILLLADVFQRFRSSCLENYKLDPAHYFTLPEYTWDCMLKFTEVNLELLTDIDMVMFIERGIRGGLSQCCKRYATANNKYLANYLSNEPSKFLIYNDINNQYGWAMSQCLPYGGLEWVVGDVSDFNFNVPANNPEGYILEVDLEYPHTIHDSHSDLPFCPEYRALSNSKGTKLMATLHNKESYVIHYRNLQQAIENGLTLTKIHRVLKFKQSFWLKKYIELNTALRTKATNDFEKNLFKLMNNAVFGKTVENVRKCSIVKLVKKWEGRYGAEALIAKPNFKSSTIFDENLVAIELNKAEVYFNKPIYVGMCILDISKLRIYDFHYSYMRSRFGDRARICYTDTDSLIYEVHCDDLYETIRLDAKECFDTSNYPDNNKYNIPHFNEKVLGMMKDENGGKVMSEFAGLRSKMYAYRVEGKGADRKAKGVKKRIAKTQISFEDYLECLREGKETSVEQKSFKSEKHQECTVKQNKIALCPRDDKRYIIPGEYDTLPWGHWRIMEST
ncbi:hypothetical protein Trydic_g11820 [Trypoxylus dichotomus]